MFSRTVYAEDKTEQKRVVAREEDEEWQEVEATELRKNIKGVRVFFSNAYKGLQETKRQTSELVENTASSTRKALTDLSADADERLSGAVNDVRNTQTMVDYNTIGRVTVVVTGTVATGRVLRRMFHVGPVMSTAASTVVAGYLTGSLFPGPWLKLKRTVGRAVAQPHVQPLEEEKGLKQISKALDMEIQSKKSS